MAKSVSSRGEVFALCGQAYQISTLVILYVDLKGAEMTVVGCQDKTQKLVQDMCLCIY